MSTAPPAPIQPAATLPSAPTQLVIVGHSNLFYYWPVWALGFLLGLLTWFDGGRAAIVPNGTEARRNASVKLGDTTVDGRDILMLPPGQQLAPVSTDKNQPAPPPLQPSLHMAANTGYGVLFTLVLMLVITITNVPLRGLWSFVIIGLLVLFALLFHVLDLWTRIFYWFSLLDIRLNMGAYFFISIILLGIWLATGIFFDRQIYMVFTPGQLKVCLEIGGGETAYDTVGLVIQKERSDLFRHWVLGLGSGDLVVRTSGSTTHEFHLNNVLFITSKLQMIEELQRERPMVKG